MSAIHQYHTLYDAYSFFNAALFNGELPDVMITHQHSSKFNGYYSHERFVKDSIKTDELCMNPDHFYRPDDEILATLVHEMCHVWQHHFGKVSRASYHNKQWADKMLSIGLIPFDPKHPAKMTGQNIATRINPDGLFKKNCDLFLSKGFSLLISFMDSEPAKKKKTPSKVKFTCPVCGQNAWAKPTAKLACGECSFNDEEYQDIRMMVPELPEDNE